MPTANPGVTLRLASGEDAPLYRRLYTCRRVMAQIAPPLSDAEADAAFRYVLQHNRRRPPLHTTWVVVDRGNDAGCGIASLRYDGASGDIGLMLLPAAWNRRTAESAIAAVLGHAFRDATLAAVTADCREGVNARVLRRLLVPLGFVRLPPSRAGYVDWRLERADWRTGHVLAFASSAG